MMKIRCLLLEILLLTLAPPGRAQWLTQSFDLKAGWNAVFLHVDATHDTLDALVGADSTNPILEVWRWNAPAVPQFTQSPGQPNSAPEWTSWLRTDPGSALQRLAGDTAYLVRVGTNVTAYTWRIKGGPVMPRGNWTISGLNLIGFPTVTNNPPKFTAFLAWAPELQFATPEIYYYPGGDLSSNNPALLPGLLFNSSVATVKRGQAFWMRSGTVFNRYFGPFEVVNSAGGGVAFRDSASSSTLRLRNLTTNTLTVTLRLTASENPPDGQSNIVSSPPLLLRGGQKLTDLTYGYTNLPVNTPRTWTLAARDQPGSEAEVVLGLNRGAITASPGALLAGVLRFTDSLGFSQVDLPVSATAASIDGLWVGDAAVTRVSNSSRTYQRQNQTNYVEAPNGSLSVGSILTNQIVQDANGRYVGNATTNSFGAVRAPYPLRLIVFSANNSTMLLQHVFAGVDASTNTIVARSEASLHPGFLQQARRISTATLPWTKDNKTYLFSGSLAPGNSLTTSVPLGFNDEPSNPFLHTYHPDHDNLNATFDAMQPQGKESYTVVRDITLIIQPPGNDFYALAAGADNLSGTYQETVTFQGFEHDPPAATDTRQLQASGVFTLKRISPVTTLTP